LKRFHPPARRYEKPPIYNELTRFLNNPAKPIILALSRPDVRKNISTLVRAFGENAELRKNKEQIPPPLGKRKAEEIQNDE